MKPLALDICCGKGGWAKGLIAEGWRVIGIDIDDYSQVYPGEFIQADVLQWRGWRSLSPQLIVASPPCQEFSRWSMPWTRAKHPPVPNIAIWNVCQLIAAALKCPLVLENVKGAQQFMGRSQANCGPFHLWGDLPAIVPAFIGRKKESLSSCRRADRATVPFILAAHIARCFRQDSGLQRKNEVIPQSQLLN
jgi:hypothetical protein